MTVTKQQIDEVALWDGAICLDCGNTRDDEEDDDNAWTCQRCRGHWVYSGKFLQETLARIDLEEGN
jgi:predicted Zn-ribbon and HTH transcriptional regulator